jgi:hypothetical protein
MGNLAILGRNHNALDSKLGSSTPTITNNANTIPRVSPETQHNTGNGIGYLGEKVGLGFLSGIEGIWDYTAGGIAKLFGNDAWAEEQFASDWVNYNHADEWFNPSDGWKIAGDVASGIGTSLPALAGTGIGLGIIAASGGVASPLGAKIILGSISAGIAGLSAAGTSTKEAYRESGQLSGKEFGYGALSGITEAGLEFVTAGIGKGTGRIVDSLAKKASKETAEVFAKKGLKTVFKELGEDFVSEAFEEGMAEFLSPQFKKITYDPNAKDATLEEITYAAMIGGLSGIVMSGGSMATGATINTAENYASGIKAYNNGSYIGDIQNAKSLSEYAKKSGTDIDVIKAAEDTYTKLTDSLKQTNGIGNDTELMDKLKSGQVNFNAKQKMYLGALKRINTAAVIDPFIQRSAQGLVMNADAAAQRYSAFGMSDINGKPLNVTTEDILSGVDTSLVEKMRDGTITKEQLRTLNKSLRKALSTNSVLATLASMEATGNILADTRKIADSLIMGENIANTADVNYLMEKGNAAEIKAVSEALGVDDITKLSTDEIKQRSVMLGNSENAIKYSEQIKRINYALKQDASTAKPLPHILRKNMQDGVYRYKSADGSVDMAILKDGDKYHIVNYETQDISEELTSKDVNKILNRFWTESKATEAKTEQSKTPPAKQTADIDAWARENINGYNSISEPNKAAVRMTVRQARALGVSEAQIKVLATVAARSGLNIVFDSRLTADGEIKGNTISINPNNSEARTYEVILGHEMFHHIFENGTKRVKRLYNQARELITKEKAEEVRAQYTSFYKKQNAPTATARIIAEEEVAARGAEEVFRSADAWKYILSEEPTLADKVLSFFRKSARDYSSIQGLSAQARKFVRLYKKMFDSITAESKGNNAFGGVTFESAEEAKMSGEVSDSRFSLQFADDIANNQRKFVADGLSRISSEELEQVIADTAYMVNKMLPHADILPQDKVGKTLVKNGSYDVSVENTTICIRTLAYNSFVDMVSEKVGRPLTQMESFLVSQKLYEIAKEPQCLYCYVSLDRKAFNEMIIRYVEQRDAAIEAYKQAGEPKLPSSKDDNFLLYKEFLYDGKSYRKSTQNMWDRYVGWIEAYKKGEELVTLEDIATEARRADIARDGGSKASQVNDMLKYAQSASWAKKQTQYVAYYDEILKLKPQVIRNLNSHYGMRWYSFSDYSGAFIVENMQQITDAAIRGLKGLSYTKDTDFAEIFAPTGMNINVSVYAKKNKDGGYEIDAKQSANIDEAIKLRKKYPNVGIVVVATDAEGVEWALSQEWSDVVIPFHTVRTGADVAEFYNWEIFNAEQSDTVTDQNLWDAYVESVGKKKASKMVYPSEHQNDRDTYLRICKERGLTPRFKSFLDNPNYMKLVNETRQSESQTSPLKAKFSLDAAERSFDKFVEKGGYYEGWYNDGIDVDGEAEIVAQDVKAGKKANEVSYGRQDINYDDLAKGRKTNRQHGARFALPETDSEGNSLSPEQREFFAESQIRAVEKDGYAEISPEGSLLPVYHGTNSGEFYEFDKKLIGAANDAGWYGRGFYFAFSEYEAGTYGRRVLKCYLNIKNPFNFSEEMGQYDGVTDGDIYFDFASFVINMARKFPEIAKTLTVDVVEGFDGEGNAESSQSKNFIELADEIESIYNSERLTVESIYDGDTEYFGYKVSDNVEALDIPSEIKKIIKDEYITSASWASYLLKDGTITQEQYDSILDAMEEYGEHNFESYYPRGRFKTREQAEKYRLSAAITYLSDKRYSYIEQHLPEYFMQRAGKQFNEELRRRGYDGVIQSTTGDEIVAFEANQIKLASNKTPSASPDIRYALPEAPIKDIALGSIAKAPEMSFKDKAQATVKETTLNFVPSVISTQIQFTNAQAGIEYAGKQLGITDIEAAVQRCRSSRSMAQEMIGGSQWLIAPDAKKNTAVKLGDGLEPIFAEIRDRRNGETKEDAKNRSDAFDYYLYHKHNVDRMSLEKRSLEKNESKKEDLKIAIKNKRKLEQQIKENQISLDEIKGKYNDEFKEQRAQLNAKKRAYNVALKELNDTISDLKKEIENFVVENNKPVLGKLLSEDSEEIVAVTADESKEMIKLYEERYPEFEKVSEKLYRFLDNLLRMQVNFGMITAGTYEYLRNKYPHYVPTYRTEKKMRIAPIKGKGNIEITKTVNTAKGSVSELEDLVLSIGRLVQRAINAGNLNVLGNKLYNASLQTQNTTYLKEISRTKATENIVESEEEFERPKNNQINIYRDGERITLAVTSEVFQGFDDFNSSEDTLIFPLNVTSKLTSGFKALVTSANPIFLVKNLIRDLQDAGINTKYARAFVKNYAKAIYHLSNNTELAQLYRAYGGFNSSVFDYAQGFTAKQSKMGFSNSTKKYKWLINKIENANMFIEQLPRFAEFISSIEAGTTVEQAILNAADITTNFGRSGKLTRKLNRTIIPFLNPAVQGLSKIVRNINDARKSAKAFFSLLIKCVILGIIPMAFNNLLYSDDEEYATIKATDKENNYLLRFGDTWIRIPKGRFVSVLAGLTNRTSEEIAGGDANWKEYFENVVSQVTPVENFTRPIWQPIFDAANNKTWYGGEIEGAQFENVRPGQRYDESTSEIAKWIGEKLNYSPKKIHYILDQYSGVIGDFVLPATSKKAERSFWASSFIFDPVTSNKLSNEFYKIYEEAKYAKSEGNITATYQFKHLNEVKTAISDMYDEISEIQNSNLPSADKLQKVRVIHILINNAYKTATDDYAAYTAAIESTAGLFDETSTTGVKMRHTEITHRMYGAEKAFEGYSSGVYESMQRLNLAGIDYEMLYQYYFGTKDIDNDYDKRGNVIEGSKRKKTMAAINKLKLSKVQKLLLLCSKGYAIKDGDVRGLTAVQSKKMLLKYILSQKSISNEQKLELAKDCGFEVKNGKIRLKSD